MWLSIIHTSTFHHTVFTMEAEESSEFVFQTNIYYGIHYPVDDVKYVCEALTGTRFDDLATDEREITVGENQFLRNVNSDATETRGVIFPDDMSLQGEEMTSPTTYCKFDPAELVESETNHAECVEITTDIYDIIIAHYKKINRSVKNIYLGWYVYNCEWCDEDSESDEAPAKSKPVKGGKDGKNAPIKSGKNAPSTPDKGGKNVGGKNVGGKNVPSKGSKGGKK